MIRWGAGSAGNGCDSDPAKANSAPETINKHLQILLEQVPSELAPYKSRRHGGLTPLDSTMLGNVSFTRSRFQERALLAVVVCCIACGDKREQPSPQAVEAPRAEPEKPAPPPPKLAPLLRPRLEGDALVLSVAGTDSRLQVSKPTRAGFAIFRAAPGADERWVAVVSVEAGQTVARLLRPREGSPELLWSAVLSGRESNPFEKKRTFASILDLDGDGRVEVVSNHQTYSDIGVEGSYTVSAWDGEKLAPNETLKKSAARYETHADQQMDVLAAAAGAKEVRQGDSVELEVTEFDSDRANDTLRGSLRMELGSRAHVVIVPDSNQALLVLTRHEAEGHRVVAKLDLGIVKADDETCGELVPRVSLRSTDWNADGRERALIVRTLEGDTIIARVAHWNGSTLTLTDNRFELGRCDSAESFALRVEPYEDAGLAPKITRVPVSPPVDGGVAEP